MRAYSMPRSLLAAGIAVFVIAGPAAAQDTIPQGSATATKGWPLATAESPYILVPCPGNPSLPCKTTNLARARLICIMELLQSRKYKTNSMQMAIGKDYDGPWKEPCEKVDDMVRDARDNDLEFVRGVAGMK